MYIIIALIGFCAASASIQYNGYTFPGYPVQPQQSQYTGTGYPTYSSDYHRQPLQNQYSRYPAYPAVAGYPLEISQPVVRPSPYGLQFPSTYPVGVGRKSLQNVPPYTFLLKNFDDVSDDIKRHLTVNGAQPLTSSSLNTQLRTVGYSPIVSYAMILNAVYQLYDGIAKNKDLYDSIYYDTVNQAIVQTTSHPEAAVAYVLSRVKKTYSDVALIRDLIKQKQQHCEDPQSNNCNMIIATAVQESNDPRLKTEAEFLESSANLKQIFISDYSPKFVQVANSNEAETYLINGKNHLKPLVLAGYSAREIDRDIIPSAAVTRRSNSSNPDLS